MSNPQTYYTTINSNGQLQDLSGIFQPISLGSSYSTPTGFKTIVNGVEKDFNEIFANITSGSSLDYDVGYKLSTGPDLRQIFAKYSPNIFSYNITDNINANVLTPIIYNGYTGLIIQNITDPSYAINATCNITFSGSKTIYILLVGGGGGGAAGYISLVDPTSGGGGGGGGYIYTSFNNSGTSTYNITIGHGGWGNPNNNPGGGSSAGQGGGTSLFDKHMSFSLTAIGGGAGLGVGTASGYGGGGGGSASTTGTIIPGGGGGGGGGGCATATSGDANLSNPIIGYLNSSNNPGNIGTEGSYTPNISIPGSGYGGNGGNSHSNVINPPFLSSGSIYYGNGGGGGAYFGMDGGGRAGSSTGGTGYGAPDIPNTAGETAIYGLSNSSYYYGNGGGGGCVGFSQPGPNFGGSGSGGVCILWWQN